MKNKIPRYFNIFYIVCIISCTLLSSCFVSNVWGRYFSQSTSNSGVRVAKWDVSAFVLEGYGENFLLSSDNATATYPFAVSSDSEVAVEYDVILILPVALSNPSSVSFTMEDINGSDLLPSKSEDGLIYTFSNVGRFSASGGTYEHMLTITANDFVTGIDQTIDVKVVLRQVN